MSRFRLIRHLLATTIIDGGTTLPIVYDTRWGTATNASTGWITFGLPGGRRRIWVDSTKTDDTGNGLTAATAKKTIAGAWSVFNGDGNWQAGDQIMLAGGSAGGTYNDPDNTTSLTTRGGTGPSVMTVVQSYDRADPTGATTPYGELVGAAMPVFNLLSANSTFLNVVNTPGNGYVAVKGVELKDTSGNLAGASLGISWQTNKHPGIVHQNCRFNGVGVGNSSGLGTTSSVANTQNGGLMSKCSQWGSQGLFIEETDGYRIQEVFSAHNGWNIGSVRDDPVIMGGSLLFSHAFYLHASNTNLWLDRVICVDAIDGLGARSGAVIARQLVSIDNPVGFGAGGKSTDVVAERPDGAPWYQDDGVVMGLEKNLQPGNPGGWAIEILNTINGSYSRNIALLDFDAYGYDAGYNRYITGSRISSSQVPTYMLIDKWSGYNVAVTAETDSGSDLGNYHISVSNSVLDVLPAGINGTVTNTTTRSVAPAGYKTRAQIYAALGYATKADFVNAGLFRPDLAGQFAQAICGIALPAMGLTPLYQTASPPTVVTGAPVIYKTSLTDLTASNLSFTRGNPKVMVLSGVAAASSLSCADLPSGFSMSAFRLTTSGTVTSGSNQVTGLGSTSGVTLGMYLEARTSSLAPASLFPAGTVITAISGTTITVSNNATGNSGSEQIFISGGGRTIRYNGSGSGAATPTIHVLETAKDTAMGTHSTAFTLSIS